MNEKQVHKAVCEYLRLQYPDIMFNTDLSGATKLTIGQAVQIKNLRSNRGWPDLFIPEPRGIYSGLWIELKADNARLYKKDGTFATEHLQEQYDCICQLRNRNFIAEYAIGFDDAKSIIDDYLNLKLQIGWTCAIQPTQPLK